VYTFCPDENGMTHRAINYQLIFPGGITFTTRIISFVALHFNIYN